MRSLEEAYAALDDLYGQLPALECKGACHDTCTVIEASELERRRITDVTGVELAEPVQQLREWRATGTPPRCPALGPLNTCRVYEVRPFICRAFGLVHQPENPIPHTGPMMCDHGCIPDATMSPGEFLRIMLAIERLSQEITGVDRSGGRRRAPVAP